MSEKIINLKVITPVKVIFDGEAESFLVKTRGEVGEFAVLYDHVPLTAAVGIGTLVIKLPDGTEKETTLFGGYVTVQHNNAVVIAEAAELPEDIDEERAEKAKERAEKHLSESNADFARAQQALLRATVRLKLYELRK
jgi:F-type H+-transporting ATPase subunit epsilon